MAHFNLIQRLSLQPWTTELRNAYNKAVGNNESNGTPNLSYYQPDINTDVFKKAIDDSENTFYG